MRSTMSKDGKRRITFTMKFRFDAETLATLLTADLTDAATVSPADYAAAVIKKGQRAALATAREVIERDGLEVPSYRVGDNGLTDHNEALAVAIRETWNLD